jgi:hypothetical protein
VRLDEAEQAVVAEMFDRYLEPGTCAGYLTHPSQYERCSGLSWLGPAMQRATKLRAMTGRKQDDHRVTAAGNCQ